METCWYQLSSDGQTSCYGWLWLPNRPVIYSSLLGAKPLGGLEPKSIPWYPGDRCFQMLWRWGYLSAGRGTKHLFSISACDLSTNLEGGHGPCSAYYNWKSLDPDVDCFTQFSLSYLLCSVMSTKEERGQGWLGQEAWSSMHTLLDCWF